MYYITIKVGLPVSGLGIIRSFNYIILIVFYACEFWSPGICLHDGGSICLIPRILSTGSFDPGIDLLVPRIALGIESNVTPAPPPHTAILTCGVSEGSALAETNSFSPIHCGHITIIAKNGLHGHLYADDSQVHVYGSCRPNSTNV